MDGLLKLAKFLDILEADKVYYTLDKIRNGILVNVAVPGERWEVEFLVDGCVEVERFKSDGVVEDESALRYLAEHYFDNKASIADMNELL